MTETAENLMNIVKTAHREIKIDPVAGQRGVQTAQSQLAEARVKARTDKRPDVIAVIDRTEAYLDSLGRARSYSSAYEAGLNALERHAEQIRD